MVEGLKRLPDTYLPKLPRMADFALWANRASDRGAGAPYSTCCAPITWRGAPPAANAGVVLDRSLASDLPSSREVGRKKPLVLQALSYLSYLERRLYRKGAPLPTRCCMASHPQARMGLHAKHSIKSTPVWAYSPVGGVSYNPSRGGDAQKAPPPRPLSSFFSFFPLLENRFLRPLQLKETLSNKAFPPVREGLTTPHTAFTFSSSPAATPLR
jgi:hypothetical protein